MMKRSRCPDNKNNVMKQQHLFLPFPVSSMLLLPPAADDPKAKSMDDLVESVKKHPEWKLTVQRDSQSRGLGVVGLELH